MPLKFIEYLKLFDGVAESFESNGGDWKAKGKTWRNTDYLPREDLEATTVINADFFGDLIHALTHILKDRYFWCERFLDRMLNTSRILKEDRVLGMIKQSWPEDVSQEVVPISPSQRPSPWSAGQPAPPIGAASLGTGLGLPERTRSPWPANPGGPG